MKTKNTVVGSTTDCSDDLNKLWETTVQNIYWWREEGDVSHIQHMY